MKNIENILNSSEYIGNLLSDMTGTQIDDLSNELVSMDDAMISSMWDQSKKFLGTVVEFKELMMMYNCAIKEIRTKFDVFNTEFKVRYKRNPINSIETRLKSSASILEKMEKKNLSFTIENIENHINDIAGVRVICSYADDIYLIAEALIQQDDIKLIQVKDYIKNPKPNGYSSLHLIVEVPVYFTKHKKHMKVEVQIRTIAMNLWASLEHQLRYKHQMTGEAEIAEQLRECANLISSVDSQMLNIRMKIEANSSDPTEEEILFEKLSKIDTPIE
jgi:putative GTP pyrophosphokinase